MSFLFLGLGILTYCGLGALLRIAVVREFRNDTPNKKLSFWGKLRRGILFPMSGALSQLGDYDWKSRMKCRECFAGRDTCTCNNAYTLCGDRFLLLLKKVDAPFSEKDRMGFYMAVGPIIRLFLALVFLVFLLGGGIVLLATGFATLVLGLVGGLNKTADEKSEFLAGKNKLIALTDSLSERVGLLQGLISEGEHLATELGGNGAAERCRALVASLKESFLRVQGDERRVKDSLGSLESEERNFQNLSRLLDFYRKVAKANAASSADVEGVEAAMAEALASCEKILEEISSEEVSLMGENLPVEALEAQVKDFTKERARLRAAQETVLFSHSA